MYYMLSIYRDTILRDTQHSALNSKIKLPSDYDLKKDNHTAT